MCQNTILCIANPEVKINLIVYELESKWYPVLISVIMFMVHFGKAMDILVGVGYAYLFFYFLRLQISDELASKIEEKLSFLAYFNSFVSTSNVSSGTVGSNNYGSEKETKGVDNFNSMNYNENKNEISVEKLDKSSDRGGKKSSSNQVNYINLEDEKT
eukprot:CAMPEP_0170516212 /NCGR_PEP_ID=MMETSP0209-20121228/2495_1 /TAXON_ID=665100 ORGANISM="Litonotus pictus, Strain P1" /NCGR_SAMPLE_ID=MMETSP0209 /ASSEMBLY_ACC=CAM_ASM_000301 /LENGTH=157 /DNA_ID=CAMNT_0010801015 /DNA_START=676 /DNA_END=1145 /DNA_ORIENTATION=+